MRIMEELCENLDMLLGRLQQQQDLSCQSDSTTSASGDNSPARHIVHSIHCQYSFIYLIKHVNTILEVEDERKVLSTLSSVSDVIQSADEEWCFLGLTRYEMEHSELGSGLTLHTFVSRLYDLAAVNNFKGREDVGYNQRDFANHAQKAKRVMSLFIVMLDKICSRIKKHSGEMTGVKGKWLEDVFVKGMIISLEHSTSHLWTNQSSVQTADELKEKILQRTNCSGFTKFLCGDVHTVGGEAGRFKALILLLKPKLTKSTWKSNPSAKHVFYECVQNLKFPYVSEYLDLIMPASLLITDDFETENKILGMKCLHHIMVHATAAELQLHNRAEVIYYSVQHQLYTTNPTLLEVVLPCLLSALSVVEGLPARTLPEHPVNRYDEVLHRVLVNMDSEQNLVVRRVYCCHLEAFVRKMGVQIVRHLQMLLRVIFSFLEVCDSPEDKARQSILDILQAVITVAWPRIPNHCEEIVKRLFKVVHEVSVEESTVPGPVCSQMVSKATVCLVLTKRTCPDHFETILDALRQQPSILEVNVWSNLIKQLS